MNILLDENLPGKLTAALRLEGHATESVHTLHLQGLENGRRYEFAIQNFDLFFTRDAGFAHNARQSRPPEPLRLLRVARPHKPQDEFVADFVIVFRACDWSLYGHGEEWP